MPISRKRKQKSAEELIRDMSMVSDALMEAVQVEEESLPKSARKTKLQNAIACLNEADGYIKQAVRRIR